ncbi:MAG: hypothetical protein AAB316_17355 [Bacteroidota bacterium]
MDNASTNDRLAAKFLQLFIVQIQVGYPKGKNLAGKPGFSIGADQQKNKDYEFQFHSLPPQSHLDFHLCGNHVTVHLAKSGAAKAGKTD